MESSIERDVYAGRLSEELGVSKESILSDIGYLLRRRKGASEKRRLRDELALAQGFRDRQNPEKNRNLKAARAEEALILLLYKNPDFLERMDGMVSPGDFITSFNKKVYEAVRLQILSTGGADLSRLGESLTPDEISAIAKLDMTRQVSNTLEEAKDCAKVLLEEKNMRQTGDELALFNDVKKMKLEDKKKTGGSRT